MSKYFICPHCGEIIPRDSAACPECGSDEETGWSRGAHIIDLPPDEDESESASPPKAGWLKPKALVVILVMLLLFVGTRSIWVVAIVAAACLLAVALNKINRRFLHSDYLRRAQLRRNLLRKARGETDLVKRMIEYERSRNPEANEAELMQNAIDRWERDIV
ncbi:MAG: hypothetical protein ABIF77_13405 [bacterium]